MSAGIVPIRPKVLFRKIEERFPDRNVGFKVNIPSSEIGGMTLLESAVLVSLVTLFDCRRLFEFGTFRGATTLLLAENTPDEARITTLDIPKENAPGLEGDAGKVLSSGDDNDAFLRQRFLAEDAPCIHRAPPAVRAKIEQRYQDSTTLDPAAQGLASAFDFVFIDGGHDYATIASDTRNALAMAAPDAVIAWHDFESKIHGDVTRFLGEYGRENRVYHVENTMVAFQLRGRFADGF